MTEPFMDISEYYDTLMDDIGYDNWIDYLTEIAEIYEIQMEPLLDVTCGTGNSTLPFIKRGIRDIIGADNSMEMLKVAKAKDPNIFWVQSNAMSLPFHNQFSLVISIFDSLNYLLEPEDLSAAISSIRESLKEGGYFIFDMNTPYGLKSVIEREIKENNENMISIWRNNYKKNSNILTLHLSLFIKKEGKWKRIDEIHREKGYDKEEVAEILIKNDLKLIDTYKCFEHSEVDRHTKRILYIAKK